MFGVWDPVLPLDAKKFSEAGGVEMVQFPGMTPIDRPCFTAVQQCGENNGPVHLDLDLGHCRDPSPVPNVFVQSAEGGARLSESGVDFIVNDNFSGECAAEVGELGHHVQALSVDRDVGFNVRLSWSWLMQYLSLLCADGKAIVVAGLRELVNTTLHLSLSGSIEGAVISEQEIVDIVS